MIIFFLEIKPISFQGNSYARYGLIKPFGKISLRFRTQQIRSVIFYQIGIRTFSILEVIIIHHILLINLSCLINDLTDCWWVYSISI